VLLHSAKYVKSLQLQSDCMPWIMMWRKMNERPDPTQDELGWKNFQTHLGAGDVDSILQLNRAGRRISIEDGSSISKGVAVLSCVMMISTCVLASIGEPHCATEAPSKCRILVPLIMLPGRRRVQGIVQRKASRNPPHMGKETRMRLE
jgi:hypothetical protein